MPVKELVDRVKRKPGKRPLLANTDVHEKLTTLMHERGPLYAEADIRADVARKSHDIAVADLIELIQNYLQQKPDAT